MWRWASCSSRGRAGARLLPLLLAAAAAPAWARVLLTPEEALRLAFGAASVERQAKFLTDAQLARARELAGVPIDSALVTRYVAAAAGGATSAAYFDTHVVRTLPETVLLVVGPDGRISRLEVVAFGEPEDYLPRARWLQQFPGRALDAELSVRRGLHGITGATLSAQAVTDAARRILAIHQVLAEPPAGAASPHAPGR